MDLIEWLQDWYFKNCDGDWEHCYGIKIETIDNPGWYVEIDLTNTEYEDLDFEQILIERDESDWILCKIEEGVFTGCGGTKNLREIIQNFYEWVKSATENFMASLEE